MLRRNRNSRATAVALVVAWLLGAAVAWAQTKPVSPTPSKSVGADNADALALAYKTAIDVNDIDGRLELHYWEGTDAKDARRLRKTFEEDAARHPKVLSSAVTKLDGPARAAYAESVSKDGNGRKPNLDPTARLDIAVEIPQPGGSTVKSLLVFPVGEKEGRAYIVGYMAKPKK